MSGEITNNLTEEMSNPLMSIDTSFRSYLNAYTRSFSNHVVGGALDYALDSDFAVRQKIQSLSAWTKLAKSINTTDITQEAKMLFSKYSQAGMLKYPEIYDLVRKCAERLEMRLPIVFVVDDDNKNRIYSIASDIIEPCIIMTTGLVKTYSKEKLQILVVMSRSADIYLLDEPLGGVDPAARSVILDIIMSNYKENATVVLSTHLVNDLEHSFDHILMLGHGSILVNTGIETRRATGKSVEEIFKEVIGDAWEVD